MSAFRAEIEAIERSQAVIRFAMDGTILNANRNFLNVLGYTLTRSRAGTTASL